MKNILLPTDLSVQSLWPIHNIVNDAKDKQVTIHLVHMVDMPSSIIDLFSIKENKLYREIPNNFIEAYQMLHHKYRSSIASIKMKFVYGSTSRFLNNFIAANDIQAVYILSNYKYKKPLAQSVDLTKCVGRSKVSILYLPLNNETYSEYQILSALLKGNEQDQRPVTMPEQNSVIPQL